MESALPARVSLDQLLGPRLWRAQEQAAIRAEPTGHAELDRALPGGGWPIGAVSEVLYPRCGVGELSLALPLLSRLTQAARPVAFVAPPMLPYAPRLAASGMQLDRLLVVESNPGKDRDAEADPLWATEQLLRAGAGAVLLWIGQAQAQSLRRLQLAAEGQDSCVLLLRPDKFSAESTPSALRLRVWRDRSGHPCVEVLKCRGAKPAPIRLARAAA